jgi:hypothetical protein
MTGMNLAIEIFEAIESDVGRDSLEGGESR